MVPVRKPLPLPIQPKPRAETLSPFLPKILVSILLFLCFSIYTLVLGVQQNSLLQNEYNSSAAYFLWLRKSLRCYYIEIQKNAIQGMPKALNLDNPVQALPWAKSKGKRSSGNMQVSLPFQPRSGLNYYVVPVRGGYSSYPELRSACLGLSKFDAFGVSPHSHIPNILRK